MVDGKEPKGDPKRWTKKVYKVIGRSSSRIDRVVVPNPKRGGWDVIGPRGARASGHFETQEEAVARAKEIVRKTGRGKGEVRVHGKDGVVRRIGSEGKKDPQAPH